PRGHLGGRPRVDHEDPRRADGERGGDRGAAGDPRRAVYLARAGIARAAARGAVGREDAMTHAAPRGLALTLVRASVAGRLGERRARRGRYTQRVAAIAKGEYEPAEKALLDARSEAGVDPELRFHAAYDLGVAFAAHADKLRTGKDADLGKALELAQQAAS